MISIRARLTIGGLLLFSAVLSGADLAELRHLDETKRYFELRRALAQTAGDKPETQFYRALIEAKFGQEQEAIGHLRDFLATNPGDSLKRKAHEELGNALLWLGQYRAAASEWAAELELMPKDDPERSGTETGRSIAETLKDVSPQTVEFGEDVPLRAEFHNPASWTVPLEIDGKKLAWVLDTGASTSLISESEAKRLGLELRDSGGSIGSGHTGIQTRFRLAVAPEMRIGRARLHNVVFVVVADRAMRFGPLGFIRLPGLVGLPVIRALGSVGISAKGEVRIQPGSPKVEGEPNIFFDGMAPVVEVAHAGRMMPMWLDTGGNASYLYPSFRDALTPEERAQLTKHKGVSGGVGGTIRIETEIVPVLRLELPGRSVELQKISLRSKSPVPTPSANDGLLGMDALKGGFTIDFRTMRLQLD